MEINTKKQHQHFYRNSASGPRSLTGGNRGRKSTRVDSENLKSRPLRGPEGEGIGLEKVGDAVWNIAYYKTALGRIDLQTARITESEDV